MSERKRIGGLSITMEMMGKLLGLRDGVRVTHTYQDPRRVNVSFDVYVEGESLPYLTVEGFPPSFYPLGDLQKEADRDCCSAVHENTSPVEA